MQQRSLRNEEEYPGRHTWAKNLPKESSPPFHFLPAGGLSQILRTSDFCTFNFQMKWACLSKKKMKTLHFSRTTTVKTFRVLQELKFFEFGNTSISCLLIFLTTKKANPSSLPSLSCEKYLWELLFQKYGFKMRLKQCLGRLNCQKSDWAFFWTVDKWTKQWTWMTLSIL